MPLSINIEQRAIKLIPMNLADAVHLFDLALIDIDRFLELIQNVLVSGLANALEMCKSRKVR